MMSDETPELLHSLRDEPIDAAVLAEVRQRVMARVETRGRRIGWWWIPAALAAAVPGAVPILLLLLSDFKWHETLALRKPALPMPPAIERSTPVRLLTRAARSRVTGPRHVRERLSPRAAEAEPLVIKLVTDDPDIVIYWLVD